MQNSKTRILSLFLSVLMLLAVASPALAGVSNSQIESAIAWALNQRTNPDRDWRGWCLAFVRTAYIKAGVSAKAYPTAVDAAYAWMSHPNDRNVPRGAYAFWKNKNGGPGHVALSLGGGQVIHTASNLPSPGVYISSMPKDGDLIYMGWGYINDSPAPGSLDGLTSNMGVRDLTETSATIFARFNKEYRCSTVGCWFGSNPDSMTKHSETINGNVLEMWYGSAKWFGTLTPGVTYYYKFFANIGGVNHVSSLRSFKTPSSNIPVSGIQLSPEVSTLLPGEEANLTAVIAPANATNKELSWMSSNSAVASVDQSGKVSTHVPGTATITAEATDGSTITGTCQVRVGLSVPSLSAVLVGKDAQLSWPAVPGATSYQIYRSVNGGSYTVIKLGRVTSYTDTNLDAGSNYRYRIRAKAGSTVSALSPFQTVRTRLAIPVISNVRGATSTAVVTWGAVANAALYDVYRAEGSGKFVHVAKVSTTSYTDRGLTPATTYRYRVRATASGYLPSLQSAARSVTLQKAKLSTPVISSVQANGSKVTITWGAVSKATAYDLYRSINNASFTHLGQVTSTQISDSGLPYGANVRYRVRATASGCLPSDLSAAKGVTIPQAKLPTPVIREVKGATRTAVVRWGTVSNATSYDVYRSFDSSDYVYLGKVSTTSYTDSGLTPGGTYQYQIRATATGYTASDRSYPKAVTLQPPASLATPNLTLLQDGNKVVLNWNKVTNALRYELYRAENGGGYIRIASISGTSFSQEGLSAGSYRYRVRAAAGSTRSGLSVVRYVTIPE